MALLTPEFLQTKSYSAKRDRLAFSHGGPVQEGVWDANDLKSVQKASGANMSVDIGQGFALISADDPSNLGLYHVQNDATVNLASFSASHATLPRIDSVYLQVNDSIDGGDANDTPTFGVATGTPTSGATLDNRSGAVAIPTGAILLADVLIPAASTSIVTANIRDRRLWARGARMLANASSGLTTSTASGSTSIPGLSTRLECSGAPLLWMIDSAISASVANGEGALEGWLDGGVIFSTGAVALAKTAQSYSAMGMVWYSPSAGSHVFDGKLNNLSSPNTVSTTTGIIVPRMFVTEFPGGFSNNN